jgi:hypothetical protein
MSMNISVWSSNAPRLPDDLPRAESWTLHEYRQPYYQYAGDGWLVNVQSSKRAPAKSVVSVAPTATIATDISLEPIGASADGYDFLESVVRAISKACDGLWEHPGDGRLYCHDEGVF